MCDLPECKVKDLCHKADKGFCNSHIMRSATQQQQFRQRQQKGKGKWSEKGGAGNNNNKRLPAAVDVGSPGQNMGPLGKADLEATMSSNEYYSEMGRAKYIDPRTIPVHEFQPNQMPPDSSSVLFGIRRTGKSWFMRWYLYEWRNVFSQVYMFTRTKINGFWEQYLPEKFIYEGLDDGRVNQIVETQKRIKKDPEWAERQGLGPRSIVLFDDIISSHNIRSQSHNGALSQLFVEGRHTDICTILATQNPTAVAPQTRDNLDFAVFFKVTKNSSKERFQDEYMGRLNKKTAFELIDLYTQTFNKGTPQEERLCLVVALEPGLTYNERFFVARPIDPGKFHAGSKKQWELSGGKKKDIPPSE